MQLSCRIWAHALIREQRYRPGTRIPSPQVALVNNESELATAMVKAQLEKTLLGAVARHIRLVLKPTGAFVDVSLDLQLLERLQIDVSAFTVQREIVAQRKLKLSFEQVRWEGPASSL